MKNDDFSIIEERANGVSKFTLTGRITSLSANVMQHKLNEAFRDGQTKIVLNMMQVAFLSSAGIRVLLMFYKRAKEVRGSLYIESPSDNVINVLGMTALDDMLLKEDASVAGIRQGGGDRRQRSGDRRQETGDRRQETGDRRQREGRVEDRE